MVCTIYPVGAGREKTSVLGARGSMTRDEFYELVKTHLGLIHQAGDVYRTVNGDIVWVSAPDKLSPEAVKENYERLKKRVRDEY